MPIYTAYANYFATGEGNTHMVLVTYAQNPDDMKLKFIELFSDYMAIGVEIQEGVIEQPPVLTGALFEAVSNSAARGGWIDFYVQFHVNFS